MGRRVPKSGVTINLEDLGPIEASDLRGFGIGV